MNLLIVNLNEPCALSEFFSRAIITWDGSNDLDEQAEPVDVHITFATKNELIDSPSIYLNDMFMLLHNLFFPFGPFNVVSGIFNASSIK